MRARKRILAGILTAVMLCGVIPAGQMQVSAEEAENVSLNKPVEVSALEVAGSYTGNLAVDGVDSDTSRWSGGYMKGDRNPKGDQWLRIDLEAEETAVTSITVSFHLKVWATKYRIETSDSTEDEWETVKTIDRAAANTTGITDRFTASELDKATLKRYVRFYFTELNSSAGGDAISVREITIMGTQTGKVESAAGVLNKINSLTVGEEDNELVISPASEKYNIEVYGSEVDRLVGESGEEKGKVSPIRIGNRTFQVILQATNKEDPTDTEKKENVSVTVLDNTSKYPELFPEVANPNPVPQVLPTIQEWYGYEGNFTLRDDSKILINDKADVGLMETAKEMQADIKEICGKTLEIESVSAGTRRKAVDIYLESLTEDIYGTGEEGYFIKNGEEGIEIYSTTSTGVLYGTVTIEQILYQDKTHTNVPKGVIRDYPLYGTRGIMFDIARIPTRIQFLRDYTKIMKWYKLNTMQLHINDNQWSDPAYSPLPEKWKETEASHRLESEVFPSLAKQRSKFIKEGDNEGRYDYYFKTHTGSTEKDGGELYYTKDEYRDIQTMAGNRGIELIAELDTPGHSAAYNKYVYYNQKEVITALVEYGYLDRDTYLDENGEVIKNFYTHNTRNFELLAINEESTDTAMVENARNAKIFMTALYDEYLGGLADQGIEPLFTTDSISAGVDEYWERQQEPETTRTAFGNYMNYMYDLLGDSNETTYSKNSSGYGKNVFMWGAMNIFPVSASVNKNIILDIWSLSEDNPIARMEEGFSVVNIPQPFLYTTPGRHHKDMVNEVYIYYNWDPTKFNANTSAAKGEPLLKGAMTALWGDENREGITEADIHERYLRLAAMVGEKNWGGTKTEDTFLKYEQTFDRLKEGPGTQIANKNDSKTNVVLDYDFENVVDHTIYDASGNGYNGTITGGEVVIKDGEKMLSFDGKTKIETPLTSLGYPYTMSFDVYLEATDKTTNNKDSALFSGYDGRLQIAGLNGKLGLNRDYFTQSFEYDVESGTKHRITIVGTYQATKLYVDGQFQKILYAAKSDPDNGGDIGAGTWTDRDNNFRTTFVFPLNVIGENFSGLLGNIKAYNKALSVEELAAEGSESTETDVARNRGAYADNTNPAHSTDAIRLFPAWKATDGDGHVSDVTAVSTSYESRWYSSDSNTDFLMVDLGCERNISKVVIDWEKDRYAAAYKIQTSLDGKTWSDACPAINNNTSKLTTDTFANPIKARYVKMQGVTRKSGANEYAIFEMKVYENVNKNALAEKITAAEALLEQENITWGQEGAKSLLHESVVLAKAVYGDVMAGQEEVDTAKAAVEKAVADWNAGITEIVHEFEPTLLELLSNQGSYTTTSWAAFQAAYEKAVNASENLTETERKELLNSAKASLAEVVTPDQLKAAQAELKNADAVFANKASYDTEKGSWKTFEAAYNAVKNVKEDISGEECEGLVNALKAAISKLEKKSVSLAAPAVTAVVSQPDKVQITWNAVDNAASYQLYRTVGGVSEKIGDAIAGATTAYDENPVGGKEMSYSVAALAGAGGTYQDSVTGSAMSISLPVATKKVTAAQVKGKLSVTIKWNKVKGASSYLIYRAEGKKAFKKIATVKKNKATYLDKKKIKKGKTYSYKVITVASKKYSPMKAAKKAVKIK